MVEVADEADQLAEALKRPRRDVVRATVGKTPDTVDVEYFGPRTLR